MAMRCVPPWPVFAGLVTVALLLLYGVQGNTQESERLGGSAIAWMIGRWNGSGGDLSHAWLVPLISVYALWRRRAAVAAAAKRPCAWGLALCAGAMLLHWVGVRAQLTRVSIFSMIALLWAMPLACYGWRTARLLIFPCAYLIFCIPFSFLDSLTVPLRIFASTVSTALLNGLGIATVQKGTAVYSAAAGGFSFDVADACSGLRSLLAMTALTAAYAHFTQDRLWRQWILFLAAVPLALAGNLARIVTIALVAEGFGKDVAMVIYHDYSGYIVFVVAILLMMGLGRLLRMDIKGRLAAWKSAPIAKA